MRHFEFSQGPSLRQDRRRKASSLPGVDIGEAKESRGGGSTGETMGMHEKKGCRRRGNSWNMWMMFFGFCSMIGFGSIVVILDEFGGSQKQKRGKSAG